MKIIIVTKIFINFEILLIFTIIVRGIPKHIMIGYLLNFTENVKCIILKRFYLWNQRNKWRIIEYKNNGAYS